MKIKFGRLEGGSALRTNEIEGEWMDKPEVGKQFVLTAKSLSGVGCRVVNTSSIKTIEEVEKGFVITTESGSKYSIEFLDLN